MEILIQLKLNDGADMCVDKGVNRHNVILCFSWRSTISVSEPGSYRSRLHKQKRWMTLKKRACSAAISAA